MPHDGLHIPASGPQPGEAVIGPALDLAALAEVGLVSRHPGARRAGALILGWLHGPDAGSLEAALGIGGPGWSHARRRLRQERRDAALRGLRARCWPDLSPSAAATLLRAAWRRAERASMTPSWEPQQTLHRLVSEGHAALSARRLRSILAAETAGHLHPVEAASARAHDGVG